MRPVLLTILDGFGESSRREHNAIAQAKTPTLDQLKATFPHGLIHASELHVGLPHGQMGNSEVGHMNIGSGRVVMQELPRIDQAMDNGSLAKNPALLTFIATIKASGGDCHLLGLLSPGGVHSHQRHMAYLANVVAEAGVKVWVHAFLDGRDTPPRSAFEYMAQFKKDIRYPSIQFATVSGRYFAMDRDKRWQRVQRAYAAMAENGGDWAANEEQPVGMAYDNPHPNGVGDEFVPPCVVGEFDKMQDGDGLLMVNFRADRAREILTALLDPDFKEFERKKPVKFAAALGMSEYSAELAKYMDVLFPPEPLKNILGEVIAKARRKQLHIAETEKYAHVTFFFNGGREEPFAGESRILVPSPKVATYDLKPEMSAAEVTDRLVEAIESDAYDFIVVNYANCDMVGHTGNLAAAISAVEAIDACLKRVWTALERKNGVMIITADHGNAEDMHDDTTGQPHTAHTVNLVPVIVAGKDFDGKKLLAKEGKLADIAPTVLRLMNLDQPIEMKGNSLI